MAPLSMAGATATHKEPDFKMDLKRGSFHDVSWRSLAFLSLITSSGCNVRSQWADRNDGLIRFAPDFFSDYFWVHRRLSRSFAEIKPYFENSPVKPYPGTVMRWKLLPKTKYDSQTGETLSVFEIEVTDNSVRSVEQVDIELQHPELVWVVHYDYQPGHPFKLEDHLEKNLANVLALAVYRAHVANPNKNPSMDDLTKDWELGSCLKETEALYWRFKIENGKIIVTSPSSGRSYQYPLSGPIAWNSKLPKPSAKIER